MICKARNWYSETRSSDGRRIYAHRLVCEKAIGRTLPPGAEVHHVDEDKRNNANRNLVICQDRKYHVLLHQRARVVAAGGNPNTDSYCGTCRQAKPWSMFYRRGDGKNGGYTSVCASCTYAAIVRRRRNLTVAP